MKQILPRLEELSQHLSFTKCAFTKRGFRHFQQYINGLITLNKKTIRQISKASIEENHHSAIHRILTDASFKQELLEKRYLRKVGYFTKGHETTLVLDDTLSRHEGKRIEETQSHYDHSSNGYLCGHQFFTSMISTPFLQMPLLPRLYSKNTDSKIEMARELIDALSSIIPLHCVIFDAWYSDKELIKKCMTRGFKVVCAIKANRSISIKRGVWIPLKEYSQRVEGSLMHNYLIDDKKYRTFSVSAKLNGIPNVNLLFSREWDDAGKRWGETFHLISTSLLDSDVQIIRQYRIRWCIETYHRDIKQNLGFAKAFFRKKEGIVRHAIFSTIAYAILKLFMFSRGKEMSIGECCAYVQNKGMDDFVLEIIEIEDMSERLDYFEEVFIRKSAKV